MNDIVIDESYQKASIFEQPDLIVQEIMKFGNRSKNDYFALQRLLSDYHYALNNYFEWDMAGRED